VQAVRKTENLDKIISLPTFTYFVLIVQYF